MTTQDPALPADEGMSPDRLIRQGAELVDEVRSLRRSVDRQARVGKFAIAVGIVLALVFGIVMADNRDRVCSLVALNIPAAGEAPAGTPHGADVVARSRGLAAKWSCPTR